MSKTYKDKPLVKQTLRLIQWIKNEDKPKNPKLISHEEDAPRYNYWTNTKWRNKQYQIMKDYINSLK